MAVPTAFVSGILASYFSDVVTYPIDLAIGGFAGLITGLVCHFLYGRFADTGLVDAPTHVGIDLTSTQLNLIFGRLLTGSVRSQYELIHLP